MTNTTDQELSDLINTIKERTFKVENWTIPLPELQKTLNYHDVIEKLKKEGLTMQNWQLLLRTFTSLPTLFEKAKEEIEPLLMRFMLNSQEKEREIEELKESLNQAKEEAKFYEKERREAVIRHEALREALNGLATKAEERVIVQESKEVKPSGKRKPSKDDV